MRTRLAAVQLPLEEEERLVERDEFREVRRVLPRRARDGLEPRAPTFWLVGWFGVTQKARRDEFRASCRCVEEEVGMAMVS